MSVAPSCRLKRESLDGIRWAKISAFAVQRLAKSRLLGTAAKELHCLLCRSFPDPASAGKDAAVGELPRQPLRPWQRRRIC